MLVLNSIRITHIREPAARAKDERHDSCAFLLVLGSRRGLAAKNIFELPWLRAAALSLFLAALSFVAHLALLGALTL